MHPGPPAVGLRAGFRFDLTQDNERIAAQRQRHEARGEREDGPHDRGRNETRPTLRVRRASTRVTRQPRSWSRAPSAQPARPAMPEPRPKAHMSTRPVGTPTQTLG